MPKMKTNSGASKRFRVTGSGKIARRTANGSHLKKAKSKSRQVRLKANDLVQNADRPNVRRLLGL